MEVIFEFFSSVQTYLGAVIGAIIKVAYDNLKTKNQDKVMKNILDNKITQIGQNVTNINSKAAFSRNYTTKVDLIDAFQMIHEDVNEIDERLSEIENNMKNLNNLKNVKQLAKFNSEIVAWHSQVKYISGSDVNEDYQVHELKQMLNRIESLTNNLTYDSQNYLN